MKKKFFILFVVTLSSCVFPRFETRMVQLTKWPAASSEQAWAICSSNANIASANARSSTQARINNQNNQVTGYNCYSQGYAYGGLYQGNSNCVPSVTSRAIRVILYRPV